MAYQILWENRSVRKLKKLNNQVIIKILAAVNKLYENPQEVGKPLSAKLKNCYRLRVGDYRLLYTIDPDTKVVKIFDVGHRKDIYEN